MSQPTAERLVAEGAAALRAGERERARRLLAQAVRADPASAQAWLFLAGAVTDVEQRRQCLERVLSLSPGHPAAQRGLASLPPPAPLPTRELSPRHAPQAEQPGPASAPPPAPAAPPVAPALAASPSEERAAPPPGVRHSAGAQTTPLPALPVEPAAPEGDQDRRLWLAILALGILMMLAGVGLALVALAG